MSPLIMTFVDGGGIREKIKNLDHKKTIDLVHKFSASNL